MDQKKLNVVISPSSEMVNNHMHLAWIDNPIRQAFSVTSLLFLHVVFQVKYQHVCNDLFP